MGHNIFGQTRKRRELKGMGTQNDEPSGGESGTGDELTQTITNPFLKRKKKKGGKPNSRCLRGGGLGGSRGNTHTQNLEGGGGGTMGQRQEWR